jgi:lipopolysaccharide transport system ATP-binding protein
MKVVKVENLSKQYRLGQVSTRTLSHDLHRWWTINIRGEDNPYLKIGESNPISLQSNDARRANDYIWALHNINLELDQGEVLGIIGKNGAGKSTLLKILSKVTAPTTGTVKARGRIASLLEVGTGFHSEMTGRENIFMNGAIMGMTKAEITRKLDEIIDFAGVERYIDTPVKRYSSGMTVRLGFAVAAHLEPEILVVDEVLAVGDAEFQDKAVRKMENVSKGSGKTILFVSHNMAAIKQLCTKTVLLTKGIITGSGKSEDVVAQYVSSFISEPGTWNRITALNPVASFLKAGIVNHKGEFVRLVTNNTEDHYFFHIEVSVSAANFNGTFAFELINQMGQSVLCSHDYDRQTHITQAGRYVIRIPVPVILRTGFYFVTLGSNMAGLSTLEYIPRAFGFEYIDEINKGQITNRPGMIFVPLKWELSLENVNH